MRRIAKGILIMALASAASAAETKTDWAPATSPLTTRWTSKVSPANALPEYPRPQFARDKWQNLNGLWDIALDADATADTPKYTDKILVPFPVESALSGLAKSADHLAYRRTFTVPADWKGQRVLLNFEASDFRTSVAVNGKALKTTEGEDAYEGGYNRFTYDITDALKADGDQELTVSVFDPTDEGDQPRGKQLNKPHGIWYTPSSGIWQTVWLEPVPAERAIKSAKFTPRFDSKEVEFSVSLSDKASSGVIRVSIKDGDREVAKATAASGEVVVVGIPEAKPWGPKNPFLYDVVIESAAAADGPAEDTVKSYFGMRKIETRKEGEHTRIFLNNEEIFQAGPLDQGFWPDGLHTPPTDEALKYDIELALKFGFNMIRKHIKIEPARWYTYCDQMGVLVWQDAVSGPFKTDEGKKQYEIGLRRMMRDLHNHPSIITWVVFNEGWGQHETERLTDLAAELDPSRIINSASGWHDHGKGDLLDVHRYPGPGAPFNDPNRAMVLGEFGGLGLKVENHMWSKENWGYQGTEDKEGLTKRFEQLWRRVHWLKENRGLVAAVYTQTTDVETETNGLVTYDREIMKIDEKRARAAIVGEDAKVTITMVVPTSEKEPQTWKHLVGDAPAGWEKPDFDDASWTAAPAPFGHKTSGAPIATEWNGGKIQLRRHVEIPEGTNLANLQLYGTYFDHAKVFINGVLAFESGHRWCYEDFEINAEGRKALKAGKNLVAVEVTSKEKKEYPAPVFDLGMATVEEPK